MNMEQQLTKLEVKMDAHEVILTQVRIDMRDIRSRLNNWRGIVTGVAVTSATIGAVIGLIVRLL